MRFEACLRINTQYLGTAQAKKVPGLPHCCSSTRVPPGPAYCTEVLTSHTWRLSYCDFVIASDITSHYLPLTVWSAQAATPPSLSLLVTFPPLPHHPTIRGSAQPKPKLTSSPTAPTNRRRYKQSQKAHLIQPPGQIAHHDSTPPVQSSLSYRASCNHVPRSSSGALR
jgi:hypothetical protein